MALVSSAFAHDPPPTTTDRWVLEPAAWILAEASSIRIDAPNVRSNVGANDEGIVRIELANVRVLSSRLPSTPTYVPTFGSIVDYDGGRAVRTGHLELHQGRTYLFAIRGGPWGTFPFVHDPLEIVGSTIACGATTSIYAFGMHGPVCGNERTHYGDPMTSEAFFASLVQRRRAASERWPAWAARLVREQLPLEVHRTVTRRADSSDGGAP